MKNLIPIANCANQFLLVCLLALIVGIVHAQTPSLCESPTTGPSGPPGNNPLCEQPVEMAFDIKIGAGTLYPNSSNLPLLPVNPRIEITGNFNVNTHLDWQGATIRIKPVVAINIGAGVSGPASLTLDNCHLYACTGLWKGILLNNGTTVKTFNGTLIEDAEGAIQAIHTQSATLDIEHTTFNRNKKGIILENTPNAINKPVFINFSDNFFHCTSTLNGTTQTSEVGIELKDADLFFFPSGVNVFRDHQYGIKAMGISSHIGTQKLYMQRIKKDGIYMEEGFLNLMESSFIDYNEKGINIETAKVVDIRSNTSFVVTFSTPPNPDPDLYHTGIYINKFALNSSVRIKGGFTADMVGTPNQVRGIHLKGGNVGAGTRISIYQSPFSIRANGSDCIFLDGNFPASSETHIFGNRFIPGSTTNSISSGIRTDGNMNNLDISGNRFTGGIGFANIAIKTVGSSGLNNYIGDNHIEQGLFFTKGFHALNFQNTTYCSNTDNFGSNTTFEFWYTNTGTIFTENKVFGSFVALDIFTNSTIDPQAHMGNEFHPFFVGNSTFRPRIICRTPLLASSSKFTVHTNQSIWNSINKNYDFFSPFYPDPEKIEPADPMFDFFGSDPNGTPSSGCLAQLTELGGGQDKDIAEGLLPTLIDNPSMAWITKGYLYKKLMGNASLASSYPSYATFLSNNASTNIGKFYEVDKKIEEAFSTNEPINQQSKQVLNDIALLIDNLAETDSLLESTTDANTVEALIQEKLGYLNQLISLTTSYNSMNATYKTQMLAKMQEALTLSQQIIPTAQLEDNQKVVNEIYLQSLVNQGGALTESQIASLKEIGQQCPEIGGLAVTMALTLLPDCEKIGLDICTPELTDDVTPESSYKGQGSRGSVPQRGQAWLYPNPAGSSFFVNLTEGNSGTLTIADLSGKTVYTLTLGNPGVPTEINQPLSSGVYLVRILTNNGAVLTEKLVIQPR